GLGFKEDWLERAVLTIGKKNSPESQAHPQYNPGGISRHEPRMEKYTPLKASKVHILKEVYHLQLLDIPPPTECQLDPSQSEWCEFHWANDHSTEECRVLKSQIKKLIQDGYLERFVRRKEGEKRTTKGHDKRNRSRTPSQDRDCKQNQSENHRRS
ncbi:hypothetical protein CR513_58957, partial [Mucuna pruriens]